MKELYIVKPTDSNIPECVLNVYNEYNTFNHKKLHLKEINYPGDSSESHLLNILNVVNSDENVKNYIYVPTYYNNGLQPKKIDTIIKTVVNGSNKGLYLNKSSIDIDNVKDFIEK